MGSNTLCKSIQFSACMSNISTNREKNPRVPSSAIIKRIIERTDRVAIELPMTTKRKHGEQEIQKQWSLKSERARE